MRERVRSYELEVAACRLRPADCGLGVVFLLVLLLFPFFAAPALAQGRPVSDDEVNAVAKKLSCPVCENIPLDVCDTQACIQWRDLIRQKLAAGETPQQIVAYFHETYGDRVLQEPSRQGFSGLLWLLALLGIVVGLVIVWATLRALSPQPAARQPAARQPAADEVEDSYRQRLERELED